MRRRHSDSRGGSRAGNYGKARVLIGAPVIEIAPPTPAPGQATCPTCRNAVTLNPRGTLRKHRDLFGHPCWQRAVETVRLVEPAPVVIVKRGREPVAQPPSTVPRRDLSRFVNPHAIPIGRCHDCGAPVSGERRYCGTCAALRMSGRTR